MFYGSILLNGLNGDVNVIILDITLVLTNGDTLPSLGNILMDR